MQRIQAFLSKHKRLTKTLSLDVITKGMGFLFIPFFLKLMTKEEFGLYSYLLYVVINFSYVLRIGLDSSLTKLYFDYKGSDKGKMLYTISITLIGISLVFAILFFLTGFDAWALNKITSGAKDYRLFGMPVFLYMLLYNVAAILNNYYVATSNVGVFQKWNLIKVIGQNLIAYIIIWIASSANTALIRLFAEAVAGLLLLLPLMISFSTKLVCKFDFIILKRALKIGAPTLGGILIGIIYTFSDKYFIQKHSGIEILAVYNLGMLLVTPIGLIFGSFHLLWLSEFFQQNNLKYSFYKTTRVYARFLVVYLALFVAMFGVIWLIFKLGIIDETYREVLFIFPIIYMYRILDNLCHLFDNFYIKLEKTLVTLIITLIVGAVTLFLFLKFIPLYGMYACAFILVVMELLRTLVMIAYIKRKIFAHT